MSHTDQPPGRTPDGICQSCGSGPSNHHRNDCPWWRSVHTGDPTRTAQTETIIDYARQLANQPPPSPTVTNTATPAVPWIPLETILGHLRHVRDASAHTRGLNDDHLEGIAADLLADIADAIKPYLQQIVAAAFRDAADGILGPSRDLRDTGTCRSIANDLHDAANHLDPPPHDLVPTPSPPRPKRT